MLKKRAVALRRTGYMISQGGKSKINDATVIIHSPCMCNMDRKYLAILMLNTWMAAQCCPWSIRYIISRGRKSNINNFTIINTSLIESLTEPMIQFSWMHGRKI